MRLSESEVSAIIRVVQRVAEGIGEAELFLFGSRTRNHQAGGDIDLALVVKDGLMAEKLAMQDYQIIAQLKSQPEIGDQKIDLKIISDFGGDKGYTIACH
jgi:hypothetical protein